MRLQFLVLLLVVVHGASAAWNEPTSWFQAATPPAVRPDPIMEALKSTPPPPPPSVPAADAPMSGVQLFVGSLLSLVIGGVVVIKLYETLKPLILGVLMTWFGMFVWYLVSAQIMLILRHLGVPTTFAEVAGVVLRAVRP